jgi:CHAD domain-containing protein
LRYTLESFRDVLGSGADGLIEEVVALQDHLGELNDAHVAAGVAHDHLAAAVLPEGDATAAAVAAYADGRQKRVTELRAGVGGILGQLLSPDFRRRLAEAVAIP